MSRKHIKLKTETTFFQAVEKGLKDFEVRFNDRDFQVGDILYLQEICGGEYTGREIQKEIKYILDDERFCKEGFVVLGLKS